MPLHLVTGRANAGKTGELHARLLASLERGESPALVLPGAAATKRAMLEFADKAPVGVAVVTFRQWANGLWRLHGDGRRIVGEASRDAFVQRAIAEVAPPALGEIVRSPGFATMISGTVSAMAGWPDERRASTEAMRGAMSICTRYLELITEGGLVEAAEAWRSLGAEPPALDGAIAVNRFANFDEPVLALLEGLSQVNDVAVALTWDEGYAPTRALDGTVERLSAVAESVTHVPEPPESGELADLLSGLYSGSAGARSAGSVRMGLAAGPEAEASLIARIAAAAIDAGRPADHIVVAVPNLQTAAHRMRAAFAAERIDIDVDATGPVAATPLGRSLESLLTLALGAGDRATAVGVLLGAHSDVPASATADLDRVWRKNRTTDPRRLFADLRKCRGTYLARAAEVAATLARKSVGPETGKQWQDLVNLLMSASAARGVERGGRPIGEQALALEQDARAARAIVRAVGEMASVEGTPFSTADVRGALRTIVVGSASRQRGRRILITETSRLRSNRYDTVIIGGLTASEMPAVSSDSLADELRALLVPGMRRRSEDDARLAFYQAISRARTELILVRQDCDDRGTSARPSVLWEEVVDAYRDADESGDEWPAGGPPRLRMSAADIAVSAPAYTQGRRELRRDAVGGDLVIRAQPRGELTDERVLDDLSRVDVFSATEIEAYLQCPYRWFYERIVRPEEIDVEVDARAVGTVAHTLLKAFYDAMPAALGSARVTPDNAEAARELLARVIADTDTGIEAEGLSEALDIARATRWVESAVTDDALLLQGFVPSDHELSFGNPGQAQVTLGGVNFRGRIDRVDRSGSAVFVTDYKSSRQVSGHDKFAEEGKVQAVVYALAAREASGLAIAGSIYRSLRTRQMRGFWRADLLGGALAFGHEDDSIGEARFEQLVSETAERVSSAVARIRAGRVPREPSGRQACGFCALAMQCEGARR